MQAEVKNYKDAFAALLARYSIDPDDDSYSGAEDAKEFISGEREIRRFASVTVSGGEFWYVRADWATKDEAQSHAVSNIDDDVFAETPILVVDLETGQEWGPDWNSLNWQIKTTEKV